MQFSKEFNCFEKSKADAAEIFGDSMLVINQLIGEYECKDDILRLYHEECLRLLEEFKKVTIEHVPKFHNSDANRLAQHASGYRLMEGLMALELIADDWRKEIVDYLKDPSKKVDRKNQIPINQICAIGRGIVL